MHLKSVLWIGLLLLFIGPAMADENKPAANNAAQHAPQTKDARQDAQASDAKELSGISIVGNDEAPKSLYIVPWKSPEIGAVTSMGMMLNDSAAPVDRDVFKRQLDFYEVSVKK